MYDNYNTKNLYNYIEFIDFIEFMANTLYSSGLICTVSAHTYTTFGLCNPECRVSSIVSLQSKFIKALFL